ncbi:hypothetical protein [Pseudomonas sp. C32]|uniref:hypothetical protein n=1 Tax=Pseudomonas sp. C32 TaxID=1529208 RepID=UPI00262D71C4|nr:hypothetical protein [Pseudomonas sp. C32]MDN4546384.1 hypothetical protein [Pseudomonas sp. C32]
MTNTKLLKQALEYMGRTVDVFATLVAAPRQVPYKGSFVYRYVEKTVHQALIQKLARLVSGLHAARLLLEEGFLQEQAALQRILDEITEDVLFLSFSVLSGESTPLREKYLEYFFQEEFDPNDDIVSSKDRAMIPRRKIRAYLDRCVSGPKGSSKNLDALRTVSKAYSGYVHAASPQIMDMYEGSPPRFKMRGMHGSERQTEHRADLWNNFCRGIMAFCLAAKAFGTEELFLSIRNFESEFLRATSNDYQSNEWPLE